MIARARAVIAAARGGEPGTFLVGGCRARPVYACALVRGLRSKPGARWGRLAPFAEAVRVLGSGELAPWPVCGLCGLPGVAPLDEWVAGHRLVDRRHR